MKWQKLNVFPIVDPRPVHDVNSSKPRHFEALGHLLLLYYMGAVLKYISWSLGLMLAKNILACKKILVFAEQEDVLINRKFGGQGFPMDSSKAIGPGA